MEQMATVEEELQQLREATQYVCGDLEDSIEYPIDVEGVEHRISQSGSIRYILRVRFHDEYVSDYVSSLTSEIIGRLRNKGWSNVEVDNVRLRDGVK